MSGYRLTLKQAPALRIDASALQPKVLAALTPAEVENMPLPHGREQLRVGDLFAVQQRDDPTLTFEGDLSRFDRIACTLTEGAVHVRGSVGVYAGAGMSGGKLVVDGDAGDLTGCAMRGGWLEVHGQVGDLAASALPGDMDGMRGGTLVVRGNAGEAFEHFVAGDCDGPVIEIEIGEKRAPHRMGMQNGADRWQFFGDDAVE